MKLYQLLVVPFDDNMDFDDWRDMAKRPNPVFLTLEGAKAYAQKDAAEVFEAMTEGDAPSEDMLGWLEWHSAEESPDEPQHIAHCDDVGVSYTIHEIKAE